ncbi:MAG: S46 family peptidase [Bacteroidales bacterium]|nr:S46 family peptidase [Bacteroidales bacterium]
MRMSKKTIIAFALLLGFGGSAFADEGMWMVNAISRAIEKKIVAGGFEFKAGDIYNAAEGGLTDAVVSLDFGCTGSLVSENGLLITNHHCAYGDVFDLSTEEHNYLEDGFWAYNPEDEIPVPGKGVYLLQRVIDVTDEVAAVKDSLEAKGIKAGSRKVDFIMESRYSELTGKEASLSSMWSGSRYYMAIYKVYTDVRLVAAPPVSIAAFGGDVDNWEWPQQKCDFAMYRVYCAPDGQPSDYSPENVPLKPAKILKISTRGYVPGDFAMVIGYPGRTNRYMSSPKLDFTKNVSLPISNRIRGEEMEIINRWMNAEPQLRLKYSDKYFSLSNVQELNCGEVLCYDRFKTLEARRALESRFAKGSPEGAVALRKLDSAYSIAADAMRNRIYYREALIRSTPLSTVAMRLENKSKASPVEPLYEMMDLRVEKDLFTMGVREYFGNVDSSYWGAFQKEIFYRCEGCPEVIVDAVWTDSVMTVDSDLFRFLSDVSIRDFNEREKELLSDLNTTSLEGAYVRALYAWRLKRNVIQYPDANSTMRLTYGKVRTFRRDGRKMPWQTNSKEILAKENDSYEFSLKPQWRELLESAPSMPVNFITDNDITGGNSGSPVLNSRGEIIGLAFDGNKESLASDVSFTPNYNRCVCVDIRFVLWTLENYAKLDRIVSELKN